MTVPAGFVEVSYHGMMNVRGENNNIPVLLLRDADERTVAVPLDSLEANFLQRALGDTPELPQPYSSLVECLKQLDTQISSVKILFDSNLCLPTQLVLLNSSGIETNVNVGCGEGIAYATIAEAPIYVSEQLMSEISASFNHFREDTPNTSVVFTQS